MDIQVMSTYDGPAADAGTIGQSPAIAMMKNKVMVDRNNAECIE
jgi:hypothetical protein